MQVAVIATAANTRLARRFVMLFPSAVCGRTESEGLQETSGTADRRFRRSNYTRQQRGSVWQYDLMSVPHTHHSDHHSEADAQTRQRWLAAEWSFISTALPPAPARLVEIGCGAAGGIVPAALAAGYQAVGVDPQAPDGAAYRQLPFENYEPSSSLDVVVSVQALHHLADLDAAVERVDRMLSHDGVLVIVEWAWERIDEATARWLFARVPADANSGWAGQRRDDWRASELPWPEYRDRWAREHGLHSWRAVESALANRFDTVLREDVPSLFGDVTEISEQAERAAIAAGEISTTGIHWIGRRRAGSRAQ